MSKKYDAKKILELSNGGLDIILHLYPEADKRGARWQKVILDFENENTASSQIIPKTVGTERVKIHSFSSGKSFDCFELVQEQYQLDFHESCKWVANELNLDLGDGKSQFSKASFEMKEANPDQEDGQYIFEYYPAPTNKELKVLGALVTKEICECYNLKSCKKFIQIKKYPSDKKAHKSSKTHKYAGKTMQIITKSSDDYPIFVFDYKTWQKIYQPLNTDKSFRFRYAGNKPKDFVFGLDVVLGLERVLDKIQWLFEPLNHSN
jgi:hypothetical protein